MTTTHNFKKFLEGKTEEKEEKTTKELSPIAKDILTMLKDKPSIVMGDAFPNEKQLYSIAGIKKYFKGKYTNDKIDAAMHELHNKKSEIKSINVENHYYNSTYPYYYDDERIDFKKIKSQYEEENKKQAEPMLKKRAEVKKSVAGKKEEKEETKKKRKTVKKETEKVKEQVLFFGDYGKINERFESLMGKDLKDLENALDMLLNALDDLEIEDDLIVFYNMAIELHDVLEEMEDEDNILPEIR